MNSAFEFHGVRAGYRDRPVLEDISLKAGAGEMLALLGPNGAGKSTLFRVLSGIIRPVAGRVMLCGAEVQRLGAARRARLLAVVPQELKMPPAFTVGEMVAMGRVTLLSPWQRPSEEDCKVIERALVYADVNDLCDRPFDLLSGGEKQRVLIAMALAQEPQVILMDEPTTHLDPNHSLEIMQIVERLNRERGLTVFMISHDLNLAAEFCRRLVLLDHGRIAADGTPSEVLREETLHKVYHCQMRVQSDPGTGLPFVRPDARHAAGLPGAGGAESGRAIHVIAGGGSGAEVLRRLAFNNYAGVTCGVLNERDTDAQVCEALGIRAALEKPFSPVGHQAFRKAEEMAAMAKTVIVCEVPFGPGNVINLKLAEDALKRGARVLVNNANLQARDYSADQQAVIRIMEMIEQGAHPWTSLHELIRELVKSGN